MDKSNIKCTIWFFDNGKKMCEEWTKEGDFYRSENKPAIVHYYENGKVSSESYFNNGLLTVRIAYYKNGKISGKTIYIEGNNHTDTDYFEDGNISQEDYYINDLLVTRIRYNKNNQIKSKSIFVNGEEVKNQ